MAVIAKRTVMNLYSSQQDIYSHQVRIVLAEKGVNYESHYIRDNEYNEDLAEVNPYYSVPTLVDRELVLYHAPIIMEYLDERFPHPPLLPVYPVARAESRKMMYRIADDWYKLYHQILTGDKKDVPKARKQLLESIVSIAPVFASKPFFLSDEFSMIDCVIAPLLWRLPTLEIVLPKEANDVLQYCTRVFARASFQSSLTDVEKELRVA